MVGEEVSPSPSVGAGVAGVAVGLAVAGGGREVV